ncbi:MAG: Fic family protein [Candidatus Desulfatibia sp.]|uniref:Fic family protein n=1 Tax=Candidatus Desulfatibia sp. TaxID=3101189 RepID=UPI002F300E14
MKPSDFTENKPGKVIEVENGCHAFVPDRLPPSLDINWMLAEKNSKADIALGELAGVARILPNPHLLINPFIQREAILSSRIEGTQSTLSELLLFEASGKVDRERSDVREVANYVKALKYGLKRSKDLPMSLRLIKELHQRLMEDVRGEELAAGEFRRLQNWIGPPGRTKEEATFVPPPVPEMEKAVYELEIYMHKKPSLPPLVRLALIHYQFEAIHPFFDGNGRVGRLLITLLLCMEDLLPQPLLYLSAYFEKHRRDYYDLLLNVSLHGEWAEWISFFLVGVTEQAKDAIKRSKLLLNLWQDYRTKIQSSRSSAQMLTIIDLLFISPVITIRWIVKMAKVTPVTAQNNIEKLIGWGILREVTGKKRNRLYVAEKILEIIEKEKLD